MAFRRVDWRKIAVACNDATKIRYASYATTLLALDGRRQSLLRPAQILKRHTRVPYFGHMGDPVAVELHYVDIVRADRAAGGRHRSTLTGMRPIENSVGGDIVPSAVGRE